jgi:hypothetical protein
MQDDPLDAMAWMQSRMRTWGLDAHLRRKGDDDE